MRKVLGSVSMVLACVLGSGLAVQAASWPQLGSPKSVVDRVWQRDHLPCIGGICGYWYGGMHINVDYDNGYRSAAEYQTGMYANPAATRYTRFLTSLLPRGSRRSSCRTLSRTPGNNGPARACIYLYRGTSILLAQYLTTVNPAVEGTVWMGATYDDITPA